MAGHSKFANIKHRKEAQDAKRGKLFTKLIREITVAARMGGEDLSSNPRLRYSVDQALRQNMTRDTVDRAIKRGVGGLEGKDMEEMSYEGYGPGGVAVWVHCLTDNRNRTVSDVRHAFSKCGGNLGTSGSVAYLFKEVLWAHFPSEVEEESLLALALDAGAEDLFKEEEGLFILAPSDRLKSLEEAFQTAGLKPIGIEKTWIASNEISLDQEQFEKMSKLIDCLEDLDDVQHVYSNAKLKTSPSSSV